MTDIFFGRRNYLEIINKRVEGFKCGYRQNIAIIGDESIGKTSTIIHFLQKFNDNLIIPVYIDIRRESLAYFSRRFIGALLYGFLKNSAITLKEDIEFLIEKSRRYMPETTGRIQSILNGREKKENILPALLTLCESLHQETGKSCVIIFDEFQNLENLGIRNLYKSWSKALISHKNTMFIILSSARFKSKYILSHNLSLLFGNFEVVDTEPFDLRTSDEFICTLIKPFTLPKHYRDFLVNFTGGYPYYLKVICQHLLKACAGNSQEQQISEDSLIHALKELLFDEMGILNLRFSHKFSQFIAEGLSQEYTSLLYLTSCGQNRIKDFMHALHKQKKQLLPKINRLIESDIIQQSGDFFKISDRLFSFWLRFIYNERVMVFSPDTKNKMDLFRNKILEMMQEFIAESNRPVLSRLAELMQSFGDECVQIGKKRVRLSQFREIKPLRFTGHSLKEGLLGRSGQDLWIIAFKEDSITEEDVSEFACECRKFRNYRIQRKIIICPKSFDSNARLRALDEKIWPWDLNNLNFILDLFSKYRVIA